MKHKTETKSYSSMSEWKSATFPELVRETERAAIRGDAAQLAKQLADSTFRRVADKARTAP